METRNTPLIRGKILYYLALIYPQSVTLPLLQGELDLFGYPVSVNELNLHLAYLEEKGFVTIEPFQKRHSYSASFVKITARGISYHSGGLSLDPMIFIASKVLKPIGDDDPHDPNRETTRGLYKICQEERTKLAALLVKTALERNQAQAQVNDLYEVVHALDPTHPALSSNLGQPLLDYIKNLERVRDMASIVAKDKENTKLTSALLELGDALHACPKKEAEKTEDSKGPEGENNE